MGVTMCVWRGGGPQKARMNGSSWGSAGWDPPLDVADSWEEIAGLGRGLFSAQPQAEIHPREARPAHGPSQRA